MNLPPNHVLRMLERLLETRSRSIRSAAGGRSPRRAGGRKRPDAEDPTATLMADVESAASSACWSDHSEIASGVILTPARVLPASTCRPSGTVKTVTPSTALTAASALTSTATIPRQEPQRDGPGTRPAWRAVVRGPATAVAIRTAAASSPTSPSSSQSTCSPPPSHARSCGSSEPRWRTVPLMMTVRPSPSTTSRQRTAPVHPTR